MKKPTLRERLSYWFDKKMSRGSLSLIKLLAIVTLVIVLIVSFLIFALGYSEEGGFRSALWNSIATTINAWMPYFDEGSPGYLILTAAAALVGLLLTSILIGIISSAIEEKVNSLKRGTSNVLESGHIVVLGFYPGEYTLLRELVLAAGNESACIVVVSDTEQEEVEQSIRENIDIPRNVRLICRTVDMFDAVSLEKCSIANSRAVVVSPTDDMRTAKALLAAASVLEKTGGRDVRLCAVLSGAEYAFPASIAEKYNITALRSSETIAKVIAHSCTQPGLSDTFRELFRFEGSELHTGDVAGTAGMRFGDLLLRMDGGVPVGYVRGGETIVNPSRNVVLQEGDRILFFAEDGESVKVTDAAGMAESDTVRLLEKSAPDETVAIIGGNESLPTVIAELPDNVSEAIIAGSPAEYKDEAAVKAAERGGLKLTFSDADVSDTDALEALVCGAAHAVVFSPADGDDDEADMESIMLLLRLRDIRARLGLGFNITAEMRREYNQKLAVTDDNTDFLVASNMSSLILAQLAESPKLISTYSELLSNEGNELYLKKAGLLLAYGKRPVAEIRRLAMIRGYIMIGYRKADENRSVFNPPLDEVIDIGPEDSLIVIGES